MYNLNLNNNHKKLKKLKNKKKKGNVDEIKNFIIFYPLL